jgi:translation initiation factor IF-2
MTESNKEQGKKLSLSSPRRLELKKTVETGQVRQSFSHGRSKAVTVEVRKKRTISRDGSAAKEAPSAEQAATTVMEHEAEAAPQSGKARVVLRSLTEGEKATRVRVLEDAKRDAEVARRDAEEQAKRRAEEEAQFAVEREEASQRAAVEEERKRKEEAARLKAEEEAARRLKEPEETAEETAAGAAGKRPAKRDAEAEEEEARGRQKRRGDGRRTPARQAQPRRRGGRLTIGQALSGEERVRSLASVRRQREKLHAKASADEPRAKVLRDVTVPESITVQELANRMAERGADVVKALMRMDVMATINQSIDADTAELVVEEFGHRIKRVSAADVEVGLKGEADEEQALVPRPPVVTIMGHVDHGKTSLLDALRETDVASGEAGGITQHIGAYQIELGSGQRICFLDTPGHEAFTAMRARGAKVTDLVVLVVAADDGVMPQTIEAINHAKAAEVPMVIAINKIDRPDADVDRVRRLLLEHEVVVESVGGDVLSIEVSAKEKLNLDKLEEAILLQAEILDLKANPDRPAEGVVVEARLESGRGSVATVLVARGTLRVGDIFVAGRESGRVRALIDDRGRNVESAGPSMPVEVLGLAGTPDAGEDFVVVESESRAREVASFRQRIERDSRAAAGARGSLEQLFSKIEEGLSELPVVIKGDVQGSVEAITAALEKLSTEEVAVRLLHTGVGGINESDITLAMASDALIIGFNVRADKRARELARHENIDIRYYSVIYDVIEDVKGALSGMLAPTIKERFLGNAEIREVFSITKVGKVAGCRVTEGIVKRGAKVRLLRDNVVIHEGNLSTLKRFKDEVREVKEGFECGMAFESYQDIQNGDVIEAFELEEISRTL